MKRPVEIRGSLLARNTLLNLIGQGLPLVVAIVTMPFVIHGLGMERFGLLSLAWVILGYFAIFDLGLGRATTKFVAEALGKGEEDQVPRLVWTAVTVQVVLGVVGALVLIGITPLLVERILNIPAELIGEAKATFYLLSLSIPVVLVSSSFRGVLEASQRFDLINAVRIPSSTLTFLLPMVGLLLGWGLPGIVVLLVVSRCLALIVHYWLCIRVFPSLIKGLLPRFQRAELRALIGFGGWVTVSSVVGPILVHLDRFLIGALLSVAAVAYYTAPYAAVTKLWIFPASLVMTLFPAFSALEGIKDRQRLGFLFARAVKYILLVLGPIVLIIGLFAQDILQVWLGADFAVKSTVVLQILALGVLINSLAHIPFALLQGAGRPDLPAKFHLLQLPIYVGIVWFSVTQWGIAGAAGAWTFRVALDAVLLFGATFKIHRFSPRLLAANGTVLAGFAFVVLAGTAYGVKTLASNFPLFIQALFIIGLFGLFAWFSWRSVLDDSDREVVLKVVKLWKDPRKITS